MVGFKPSPMGAAFSVAVSDDGLRIMAGRSKGYSASPPSVGRAWFLAADGEGWQLSGTTNHSV